MWLARLWQSWGDRSATRCRTLTPARKARLRLGVERLEDRTVPASFTATDVADLIADINAANQTPEADTIALVAGMTYTMSQVNNSTNGPTGLPTVAAQSGELTILGNGGTAALHDAIVTDNLAQGGAGGQGGSMPGRRPGPNGPSGRGEGGGVFIEADALACLDAFTVSKVKKNKASNIAGPYTICS